MDGQFFIWSIIVSTSAVYGLQIKLGVKDTNGILGVEHNYRSIEIAGFWLMRYK